MSPPSAHDRRHSVRLAFGNGLRPDVWSKFRARFGVAQIMELYASTEGNANLVNTEGQHDQSGRLGGATAGVSTEGSWLLCAALTDSDPM